MSKGIWIGLGVAIAVIGASTGGYLIYKGFYDNDPFRTSYDNQCASCHGEDLEGTDDGPTLLGPMQHGSTVASLVRDISAGNPEAGMPGYGGVFGPNVIKGIAIYIAERRVDQHFTQFRVYEDIDVPEHVMRSEEHNFRLEVITADLHPRPYSMAPLPDGGFIVTEKTQGVRLVSPEGEISDFVAGAPVGYDDGIDVYGLDFGIGHLLDVALHPDYEDNGWVYIHYGHRCEDCNQVSRDSVMPVSMNRVIRGRIRDGAWHDEEVIWQADEVFYSSMPDTAAGGRLTFDGDGYLYMSVGLKALSNFEGPQDMRAPYGKTFRLADDGTIPSDNPFYGVAGVLPEIWTWGHRSPQGLDFNRHTGELWGTEHGPRGGDEVNVLKPGRNYGWPLYSLGMDYDLTAVEYGVDLNMEFDLADIEQPAVDLTPSPAVSNLLFYEGNRFPNWTNDLFVGSLKATDLYRMVVDGDRVVHMETVITDLGRIRDIETGPDGLLYLLLEAPQGGVIVRLVPEDEPANMTASLDPAAP